MNVYIDLDVQLYIMFLMKYKYYIFKIIILKKFEWCY